VVASVAIQVLQVAAIGTALVAQAVALTLAAIIVELPTALQLLLVVAIVWYITVTASHTIQTMLQVIAAAIHLAVVRQVLGYGLAEARVAAHVMKIKLSAADTVRLLAAAAALVTLAEFQ
jgi:hypothetical protein